MSPSLEKSRRVRVLRIIMPPEESPRALSLTKVPASLGALEKFPTEIMIEILLAMDIPTLIQFSAVNRQAKAMFDQVREYGFLIKKYPKLIKACVTAKADSFSCLSLYNQLSLPRNAIHCQISSCERRGEFVWILTGSVLCGSHVHQKMGTTVIPSENIWYNRQELAATNHIILKSPYATGPRFFQAFDQAEFCRTMPPETRRRLTKIPYGWGYSQVGFWLNLFRLQPESTRRRRIDHFHGAGRR